MIRQDYRGDADYFGVYCSENDEVYLVPVADVPVGISYLRLLPTSNNQQAGTRWARDYRL